MRPSALKSLDVRPGDLMIWQHHGKDGKPTAAGHVGVVTKVLGPGRFETVGPPFRIEGEVLGARRAAPLSCVPGAPIWRSSTCGH